MSGLRDLAEVVAAGGDPNEGVRILLAACIEHNKLRQAPEHHSSSQASTKSSGSDSISLSLDSIPPLASFLLHARDKGAVADEIFLHLCSCLLNWKVRWQATALQQKQWNQLMPQIIGLLNSLLETDSLLDEHRKQLSFAFKALLLSVLNSGTEDNQEHKLAIALKTGVLEALTLDSKLPLFPTEAVEILQSICSNHLEEAEFDLSPEGSNHDLFPLTLAAELQAQTASAGLLPLSLATRLKAVGIRRLRRSVQTILQSIEEEVVEPEILEELAFSLRIPHGSYGKAAAKLAATAAIFEAEEIQAPPLPDGNGLSHHSSESLDDSSEASRVFEEPVRADLNPTSRPSAGRTMRGASRAALRAASRRLRDSEGGQNTSSAGLEGVVTSLLDVVEGCLAFCWEIGPGEEISRQVLELTRGVVSEIGRPLSKMAATTTSAALDQISRLRAVSISSSLLAESEEMETSEEANVAAAAYNSRTPWTWDLLASLSVGSGASGAEAVCREASEAVCAALEAAWRQGSRLAVDAASAAVADSAAGGSPVSVAEYRAILLTLGRLVVVLGADERMLRPALPLISDTTVLAAAPEIAACAFHVLASIAAASAANGQRWAFEQASEVLIKAYRPAVKEGAGQQPPSPKPLAEALQLLAQKLRSAALGYRLDFELKLLNLFSDLALGARKDAQLLGLGALLPVIADAGHDRSDPLKAGLPSGGDLGFQTLQDRQRVDAQLVKLYRVLWVNVAVHELHRETPGKTSRRQWPAQWRAAAVRIAQGPTPLLVVGGELDIEQVDAELGGRLKRLSKVTSPLRLATKLLDGIRAGQVPAAGLVASAGHPARNAHLLSTLTLNLLRVEQPLPASTSVTCPMAPLLLTQQTATSKAWESPWLAAITERVFDAHVSNLVSAIESQAADPELLGRRQIALAQTLVRNLRNKSINKTARDLADELLGKLFRQCRALMWQPETLSGFLEALDAKDASGFPVAVDSRIVSWLRKIVEKATLAAPGLTEAMLQEILQREPEDEAIQSQQEAQSLLGVFRSAKAKSPLGILEGSPSGVVALHRKAHFGGILSGMLASAAEKRQPQDSILESLGNRLEAALQDPLVTDKLLSDRVLEAAAGLVMLPQSSQRLTGLRRVCWVGARSLKPSTLRAAIFAWQWIAVCSPELQMEVLAEVVNAWLSTARAREGVFEAGFDAEAHQNDPSEEVEGAQDLGEGEAKLDLRKSVGSIQAHHLWLLFLLEAWQVWGMGLGPNSAAVEALLGHWARNSLASVDALTHHPAAAGTRFRLLLLALQLARHLEGKRSGLLATAMLFERILQAALGWFDAPLSYFGEWSAAEGREEIAAVVDFNREVERAHHWPAVDRNLLGKAGGKLLPEASAKDRLQLLRMLLHTEEERLRVWAEPLGVPKSPSSKSFSASTWRAFAGTAWKCNPRLAINLIDRFPKSAGFKARVAELVVAESETPSVQTAPKAAELLAASAKTDAALAPLERWAPALILQALHMMSGGQGERPAVRAYALRSLLACDPKQVAFFLPQLVQLLRSDANGMIRDFLLRLGRRSTIFAHHLICTLRSEGRPPPKAFNPTVKRSGWQPPQDSGLWSIATDVEKQVWAALPPPVLEHLKAELAYFDELTDVSGKLYPVAKDERKGAAVNLVEQIEMPRTDLYLPTNPSCRVVSAIARGTTPMQSAAKVPILVPFEVVELEEGTGRVQACIFKVGDDCRQDVLALQVIGLLKDAFSKAGLGLYLAPYGVLPTSYECGIIEVVPDSKSRSALGETTDGGLLEIWCREFGAPGTERFEQARHNFIVSGAGYAVACYLLQAKDRHNGNILVDGEGHLVHIDFGFILEISPGGNLGFESAAFKLSHEMTQLLDPSGNRTSPQFRLFQELCIRGYLAARNIAEGVLATVQLMSASGLPCYGRGAPVENLRKRFHLEMSDAQAAAFMRATIADAYDKWTTGFYDFVQYLQNSIPK